MSSNADPRWLLWWEHSKSVAFRFGAIPLNYEISTGTIKCHIWLCLSQLIVFYGCNDSRGGLFTTAQCYNRQTSWYEVRTSALTDITLYLNYSVIPHLVQSRWGITEGKNGIISDKYQVMSCYQGFLNISNLQFFCWCWGNLQQMWTSSLSEW